MAHISMTQASDGDTLLENDVGPKVLPDIDVAFHDCLVHELGEASRFRPKQNRLEQSLGGSEQRGAD